MFKARFSRREDGGYAASYGKGSRKITAVVLQAPGGAWDVTEGFGSDTVAADKRLGAVKEAWGLAATAAYDGVPIPEEASTAQSIPPPPPLLRRTGPPSLAVVREHEQHILKALGPLVKSGPLMSNGGFDDTLGEGFSERFPSPEMAKPGATTCPTCLMPLHGWSKAEGSVHERFVPPCRCNLHAREGYEPDPLDMRMYRRDQSLTPIGALDLVFAWMAKQPEYVKSEGKLDEPWSTVQRVLFETTGYAEFRPGVLGDRNDE